MSRNLRFVGAALLIVVMVGAGTASDQSAHAASSSSNVLGIHDYQGARDMPTVANSHRAPWKSVQAPAWAQHDPTVAHFGHAVHSHAASITENAESTNWAGVIDLGTQFSAVSATWVVPTVQPSAQTQVSSNWIGVDGATNDSLIQTGTTQATAGGATDYFAWYEILPDASVPLQNFPVSPGDHIAASIVENSPGQWTITIADVTSNHQFQSPFSYNGPATSTEWIEEAPTDGGTGQEFPLANFGSVQFANLAMSAANPGSVSSLLIDMVDLFGHVIAYPGPVANNAFAVTFGSPPLTTTTLSVSPAQAAFGQSVTYSATVTGANATPTGTVDFTLFGVFFLCTATLTNGTGSCHSADAPPGTDHVTAFYNGDPYYAPSFGMTTLTVAEGSSSVTAAVSPTSSTVGQSVTYSVVVKVTGPAPSGLVAFNAGATILCTTVLSNGNGSCPSADAPAGTDLITATYFGDYDYAGSIGTTTLRVSSAPPTQTQPTSTTQHGYWLVGGDGGIFSFGTAQFYGSTGSLRLQRPVVGISPTSDHAGYWLVGSDGGIFSFGDAGFHGSIPGLGYSPAGSRGAHPLNAPVVAMVTTADGGGYFMVASDGGVFSFGDARFEGSCPGIGGCVGTAVTAIPDASGNGYWLVTATGAVYSFGDAQYFGAPGAQGTVTSAMRTPDGRGYWILMSNGKVFAYGDAVNLGGLAAGFATGTNLASSIFATSDGGGYWITTANGSVYRFGDAVNAGSMSSARLNAPIIAAYGW